LLAVVLALLAIGGCEFHSGWSSLAKFEKTVELSHPLQDGGTLAVSTASGSIDVSGQTVNRAEITAKISTRAGTEEEAEELAEQVVIRLEGSDTDLEIKTERPKRQRRQSISISYEIVVPNRTTVKCSSASGSLRLKDLIGDIDAHTSSGSVSGTRIEGPARLSSASGSIRGQDIKAGDIDFSTASGGVHLTDGREIGRCRMYTASGSVTATNVQAQTMDLHSGSGRVTAENVTCSRLKANSGSGSVAVAFSETSPSEVVVDARSGSGSINVVTPPNFAGRVDLSTSSGSVNLDLPVTVTGRLSRKHISGTVGQGAGHLTAQTSSGSIRVK